MLNTHKISNVRVFPDDVQLLLPRLPLGSLSAIYLFFPDPWPKKRHNKRRLVNPVWVKEISQRLKPGGILHMATDWEEYAYHMLEVMEGADHFVNNAGSGCFHPRPEWRPVTRFERRGERLGHNQWDLIFTFKGEKS
jgi:tRNA (guanine-N7-)-methyltransferase